MSDALIELARIQKTLKAPKGQYNAFAKFSYRSAGDILEAVKLVTNFAVTVTDELLFIGNRYYISSTASLINPENGDAVSVTAYAREAEIKKGMDPAQITGAASSYSKKYALGNLFAIDETVDPDATNNGDDSGNGKELAQKNYEHKQTTSNNPVSNHCATHNEKAWYNEFDQHKKLMEQGLANGTKTVDSIIANIKKVNKMSQAVESQIRLLEEKQ